ncbi:DUF1798 family protein [Sporolactobacillus shoreae]|uniref:DUF1798 family protein n=1 Tax=Sporolactobacillus shoreae TaxID=1465501 RepID=A0A4Z0GLJ9_9BACL|nr:YppE family protein [Sporolactobacillus shoreae]TGA97043.1 DUF1798 family protein [Sporolactobacillus shoreae]
MENQMARLEHLTHELKDGNMKAYDQYMNHTRSEGYQVDFQNKVKPFADRYQVLIDEWKPLVTDWVMSQKPNYVYPIQIKDTCENLSIVIVTAFQKDTRRRRFIETIKAIDYVLDNVLEQLKENIASNKSAGCHPDK